MKFFYLFFFLFIISNFSKSFGCHETGDSNCTPNQNVYTGNSGTNTSHKEVKHHEEIKDDSFNDNPRLMYIIDDFGKEIRGSNLNNIRAYKLKTKNKQMFIIQVENLINNLKNDQIDHYSFLNKVKFLAKKVLIIINENNILDKNEKLQLINKVNYLIDFYVNISLGENKKYTRINNKNNVNIEMVNLKKRIIDLEIVNKTMEIFYSNNYKSIDKKSTLFVNRFLQENNLVKELNKKKLQNIELNNKNVIDKSDLKSYNFKINDPEITYLQNSIKDVNYANKVLELMKIQSR